jgi:hypothetical protein
MCFFSGLCSRITCDLTVRCVGFCIHTMRVRLWRSLGWWSGQTAPNRTVNLVLEMTNEVLCKCDPSLRPLHNNILVHDKCFSYTLIFSIIWLMYALASFTKTCYLIKIWNTLFNILFCAEGTEKTVHIFW